MSLLIYILTSLTPRHFECLCFAFAFASTCQYSVVCCKVGNCVDSNCIVNSQITSSRKSRYVMLEQFSFANTARTGPYK